MENNHNQMPLVVLIDRLPTMLEKKVPFDTAYETNLNVAIRYSLSDNKTKKKYANNIIYTGFEILNRGVIYRIGTETTNMYVICTSPEMFPPSAVYTVDSNEFLRRMRCG
ncbi:hypothetical protein BLOT_005022 [Blomia tropicalis]|nr:hypothetical protein BLOT_005022 [Blomia tropicalis]